MTTSRNIPVLLHGGGIDSTAVFLMLATAKVPFSVLHVDYGQEPLRQERAAIRSQCKAYKVPFEFCKLPGVRKGFAMYKGRNALLLAFAFTRTNRVYAAMSHECLYADSKAAFIDAMEDTIRMVNAKAEIVTPLFNCTKTEEYRIIQMLDPKVKFWTCNDSRSSKPCGKCGHCEDLGRIIREIKTGKKQPLPKDRMTKYATEKDEDI